MEIEDAVVAQVGEAVQETVELEEEQAVVSLNSVLGNMDGGASTMRICGKIGSKTIHILLDTRSSHNFLSDRLSRIMSSKIEEMRPLQVTVADGGKIQGTKMIKGFMWSIEGQVFSTDVILFPLVGCDLILDMQRLKTLGSITWNCADLIMEFDHRARLLNWWPTKGWRTSYRLWTRIRHEWEMNLLTSFK